jgi:DNA-binding NarL/FixJ family response regulator
LNNDAKGAAIALAMTECRIWAREEDCLRLLVGGASDKLIARQLKLSPVTTCRYIKTARSAYGAATRADWW